MSTWFPKEEPTWLQNFAISVLKEGRIPNHIAVIMDGNRRYAKENNMQIIEGHSLGFKKATMVMKWCRKIGVKELSLYAFSIENFKRTKEQVDQLLILLEEKLRLLVQEREKTREVGLCVRILGNLKLVPVGLQQVAAVVMLDTINHTRFYLNLYVSYTARDEIAAAVRNLSEGVQDGVIKPSDVTESLLEKSLFATDSPPVDLLVRTSGEVRMSDFMMWQSCYSVLVFSKGLWPSYSIWTFLGAMFYYQRACKIPLVNTDPPKTKTGVKSRQVSKNDRP